ncbi:MAG: pyridoxamine 5'-phosphate oxidase [Candidatus Sericytochromatia bacterium]
MREELTDSAADTNPFVELRREYLRHELREDQVDPDPIRQFAIWFEEAVAAGVPEPNAMTLATVGADLMPSARVVLLKDFDASGFVFFTNYNSRKGRDIAANPQVSLSFFWPALERQVRIEGRAQKVDVAESDAYFASRPEGARLGAHVSNQSEQIPDRPHLEAQLAEVSARFAGHEIPRPAHWGGYRVIPARIEFWQGRPSRLHDRLVYTRQPKAWNLARLAP